MKENLRKKRIENILKKSFSPTVLLVRDDSKKHEGHSQISTNVKETHFFVEMVLDDCTMTKLDLHRKVYKLLDDEFSCGLHALELDLKIS